MYFKTAHCSVKTKAGREFSYVKTPHDYDSIDTASKAVLHEAIFTKIAAMVNANAASPLIVPECKLDHSQGLPGKLVTEPVPFNLYEDFCHAFSKSQLINKGFGAALALRYALKDPDGPGNTGFNKNKQEQFDQEDNFPAITQIDFGLAHRNSPICTDIFKASDPNYDTPKVDPFKLEPNILNKMIPEETKGLDGAIRSIHPGLTNGLKQQDKKTRQLFLDDIKNMLSAYADSVTNPNFKSRVMDELGINDFEPYDTFISNLLNEVVARGRQIEKLLPFFKLELRDLSRVLNKQSINIIAEYLRKVNAANISKDSKRAISPAHGNHVVLQPVKLSSTRTNAGIFQPIPIRAVTQQEAMENFQQVLSHLSL